MPPPPPDPRRARSQSGPSFPVSSCKTPSRAGPKRRAKAHCIPGQMGATFRPYCGVHCANADCPVEAGAADPPDAAGATAQVTSPASAVGHERPSQPVPRRGHLLWPIVRPCIRAEANRSVGKNRGGVKSLDPQNINTVIPWWFGEGSSALLQVLFSRHRWLRMRSQRGGSFVSAFSNRYLPRRTLPISTRCARGCVISATSKGEI